MKRTIFYLFLLFLVGCNKPSMHLFTRVSTVPQPDTININTIHIISNGYVAFATDTTCQYNQLLINSKEFSWVKKNCYNIVGTDRHTLLLDALKEKYPVLLAISNNNTIQNHTILGYYSNKKTVWLIVDNEIKKYRINELELFKKSVVLLIHKDAARSILNKIIK